MKLNNNVFKLLRIKLAHKLKITINVKCNVKFNNFLYNAKLDMSVHNESSTHERSYHLILDFFMNKKSPLTL